MTTARDNAIGAAAAPWWTVNLICLVLGCGSELAVESEVCRLSLPSLVEVPSWASSYPDKTLAPAQGIVIDHTPTLRGEHPVERYWFDAKACQLTGGWYAWGPPAPTPEGASLPLAAYRSSDALERLRILTVTTPDSGAVDDAGWWRSFAVTADASFAHVHALTADQALTRVDDLCSGTDGRHSVLLVLAGAASAAGGGAFVLPSEGVSFQLLFDRVLSACANTGLVSIILDASYGPPPDTMKARDEGFVFWSASSPEHPFAARSGVLNGGLLSDFLSSAWARIIPDFCRLQGAWQPQLVYELLTSSTALQRERRERRMGEGPWAAAEQHADAPPRGTSRTGMFLEAPQVARAPAPTRMCILDADCFAVQTSCKPGACKTLVCDNGRCKSAVEVGQSCDDGSLCTAFDRCDEQGLCTGDLIDCDDDNPCTDDGCDYDSGCRFEPSRHAKPCDDGLLCTLEDACQGGLCAGIPVLCDDADPCTDDSCTEEEGCTVVLNTSPCDDADPCTGPDFCQAGFCRGSELNCDDGNPCTQNSCLDSTCSSSPAPDGLACDDQDPCTLNDRCIAGSCTGASSPCDDGLECTLDQCDDGDCKHLPAPGTCLSPTGCIEVGSHPADNPCLLCEATDKLIIDPEREGLPCTDDGLPCTQDQCVAGHCTHTNTPDSCLDHAGQCVQAGDMLAPCLRCVGGGVALAMDFGEACDDGQDCTDADTCQLDGACKGLPQPCCEASATALTCGEITLADSGDQISTDDDPSWACLPFAYSGPHQLHTFESPCDGTVTFTLDGSPGQLLIAIKSTPGAPDDTLERCEQASCDAYSTGPLPLFAFTGQRFVLAVDSLPGYQGPYALQVECDCQQPAP